MWALGLLSRINSGTLRWHCVTSVKEGGAGAGESGQVSSLLSSKLNTESVKTFLWFPALSLLMALM